MDKKKGEGYENFYWQNGYGAFSVNPSEIDTVITYITNQHEHHRKETFQDEYRAFLKKYKVEYDERCLGLILYRALRDYAPAGLGCYNFYFIPLHGMLADYALSGLIIHIPPQLL